MAGPLAKCFIKHQLNIFLNLTFNVFNGTMERSATKYTLPCLDLALVKTIDNFRRETNYFLVKSTKH